MRRIPLFLLVALAYNFVVFQQPYWVDSRLWEFQLASGARWVLTGEDALLMASIGALYVEVVKATIADSMSIVDHVLSLGVFIFCAVEFITLPELATSTFLLITLMALVDVIAGFSVTWAARRGGMAIFRD